MVETPYSAGATRVDVVVTGISPNDFRDHSRELDVIFPKGKAREVVDIVKTLHPDNWEMDLDEGETVDSVYDEYLREVMADPASDKSCALSWD